MAPVTPRLSLGARLAVLFAAVVAVASSALGFYLYHSFAGQLEWRDDVQLLGKLRQLRQQLADAATPELLLTRPQYLRDTMSGESNALIEVRDTTGRALLTINPRREALPAPAPLAENEEPTPTALVRWRTRDGSPAAAVTGVARLGQPDGRPVVITVARAYPDREALLAAYRWRIGLAATAAALLAALLSTWVVWRALAPLRRLSREAGDITVNRLSTRLVDRDAPPEIARLIAALNTMLARLEDGFARLSQFAADLAHEFRTPVGNLLGQSQVMLARPRPEAEYQALLESNIEELERLARMIDNMLFLARADHAGQALDRQPLSIAAELTRQAEYFEGVAEERGLTLLAQGDGTLWADPALLRRALGNLVANAVRHATPGSTIRLAAAHDGNAWNLMVENDGAPLPEDVLARLFDRFYRADTARADSARSNGLGLAIVRSIMALHGGQAQVAQAGSRLRFTLTFPDAPGPAA